jgi:hypothetical protein
MMYYSWFYPLLYVFWPSVRVSSQQKRFQSAVDALLDDFQETVAKSEQSSFVGAKASFLKKDTSSFLGAQSSFLKQGTPDVVISKDDYLNQSQRDDKRNALSKDSSEIKVVRPHGHSQSVIPRSGDFNTSLPLVERDSHEIIVMQNSLIG